MIDLRRTSGFTLIELMIALALSAFLTAMVASLFVAEQKAMTQQNDVVDMNDNSRVSLELLSRDIRNAGFLHPTASTALMLEDNCGASGNSIDFNPAAVAPNNWSQPRATTGAMTDGDVTGVKTKILNTATTHPTQEKCPNGSDRITVFGKRGVAVPSTCNESGCMAGNTPLTNKIDVPCKNANPGSGATYLTDCAATLAMMAPDVPVDCSNGTTSPFSTLACLDGSPSNCATLPVASSSCSASCNIKGGGTMPCVHLNLDTTAFPNTNYWGPVGGAANADMLVVGGYFARTYQLLDIDEDGATELVYSDHVYEGLLNKTASIDPHWAIVANNIDDLQFAYTNTPPTGWDVRSLYPSLPCTPNTTLDPGNNTLGGFNCLDTMVTAKTQPNALRVSIIARATRRDIDASDQGGPGFSRGTLENNVVSSTLRPFQPYTTVAGTITSYGGTNVAACTVANYDQCAGNGNAGGFRRRVFTQVIGLRNLVGFNF